MTYTAIPNGDIDADSPGTTGLFTKLRDNPIAIANGDAGAPSIVGAALADNAVLDNEAATAGNNVLAEYRTAGVLQNLTVAWVKVAEIYLPYGGTFRVLHSIAAAGTLTPTASSRVYKNGSAHGTQYSTTSTAAQQKSEDLVFASGDFCQLYLHISVATKTAKSDHFIVREATPNNPHVILPVING